MLLLLPPPQPFMLTRTPATHANKIKTINSLDRTMGEFSLHSDRARALEPSSLSCGKRTSGWFQCGANFECKHRRRRFDSAKARQIRGRVHGAGRFLRDD